MRHPAVPFLFSAGSREYLSFPRRTVVFRHRPYPEGNCGLEGRRYAEAKTYGPDPCLETDGRRMEKRISLWPSNGRLRLTVIRGRWHSAAATDRGFAVWITPGHRMGNHVIWGVGRQHGARLASARPEDGQMSVVPGSRASSVPSGRQTAVRCRLKVEDRPGSMCNELGARRWTSLPSIVQSWSHDSQHIYYTGSGCRRGGSDAFRVADRKIEKVVSAGRVSAA